MVGNIITLLALTGGQGKTTLSIMIGRKLSRSGIPVLLVDADPQASLTTFMGIEVQKDSPSLLEVLADETMPVFDAIAPVDNFVFNGKEIDNSNLFVIPSDGSLEKANILLAESGRSLYVLRERLLELKDTFGVIIVDSPPQRSHLALTSLGAGDRWIIPSEATAKGALSLERTLTLIKDTQRHLSHPSLLGIVPFRTRWVGQYCTQNSSRSMEAMAQVLESIMGGEQTIFPSVLESEKFKNAIDKGLLPSDLGATDIEHPIETICNSLKNISQLTVTI